MIFLIQFQQEGATPAYGMGGGSVWSPGGGRNSINFGHFLLYVKLNILGIVPELHLFTISHPQAWAVA